MYIFTVHAVIRNRWRYILYERIILEHEINHSLFHHIFRELGLKSWKSLEDNEFGLVFSSFRWHSHLQLPMLVVLYHILAYQGIVTFFTALKRQKKDQFEEVPPEENESKSLDLGKFNIRSLINFLFPRPQYYFKTLYLATNAAMMVTMNSSLK